MAVVEVRTFGDIQDAILRRGKIEDTADNRLSIKEYINTLYQQICREEAYRWCGATLPVLLRGKYTTGTITTVDTSDTVTGDSTVWVENTHRYSKMKISGCGSPFKILRVASNTSITLDQPWIGTGAASTSYAIYRDEYGLFPDLQDIRKFRIPGLSERQQPRPIGPDQMDALRDQTPFREGTPLYYTIFGKAHYTEKTWATFNLGTDFWEESLDVEPQTSSLVVWPGIMTSDRVALVRYTKSPYPLGADADEPIIPYEDRSVLVWGVLAERFLVNRDIQVRKEWQAKFVEHKKKMASDIETTDDELVLWIDRSRYRRQTLFEDEDEIATTS